MYYLKSIHVNSVTTPKNAQKFPLTIANGPCIVKTKKDDYKFYLPFWENSSIMIEEGMTLSDSISFRLEYVSEIQKNYCNTSERIDFIINKKSRYEPIEGYILFIEKAHSLQTSGEILYVDSAENYIIKLREGTFVEFAGNTFIVLNSKLWNQI